jgi:CubicO group peptidase (beta-lactamase class C family)
MSEITGIVDARFENLGSTFNDLFAANKEVGASIAVTYKGELVVDAWGGFSDVQKTKPWREDTITNVFSSGKTVIALSALLLVDRGQLDVDQPVAKYWPEFAQNGKSETLVRHLMSHSSGLMGWNEPFAFKDLFDWEKATSTLAAQAPWFEPGTRSGYHMVSYGYLVGEVVRRITGLKPNAFMQAEYPELVNGNFYFGLPDSEIERYSPFVAPEMKLPGWLGAVAKTSLGRKALGLQFKTVMSPRNDGVVSDPSRMRSEIPNQAIGNARGLAQIQSIIVNHGEVDGKKYLSDATVEKVFRVQSDGRDVFFRKPVKWGIGYALSRPGSVEDVGGRVAYWQGFGGSRIICAVDKNCTFSYVMNKGLPGLLGDDRGDSLSRALALDLKALK